MTDKQIIFDDVDVKDCIAYAKSQTVYLGNTVYKQMEKVCMVKNQPCKFFDCQFKQMARELKRKEQECEEWQAKLAYKESELQNIEETIKPLMKRPDDLDCYNLEWIVCAFANEFNQLKAENNELKKTVDDLLHKPEIQDKILWKIDNEALLGSKDACIYKLEKTLTEIKEIAYAHKKDESVWNPYRQLDKILQKISEVEDEN